MGLIGLGRKTSRYMYSSFTTFEPEGSDGMRWSESLETSSLKLVIEGKNDHIDLARLSSNRSQDSESF